VVAGRKIALRLVRAVVVSLAAVGSAAQATERGAVLVLFHGCDERASSADWKPLRDALPPGITVVAPELPKIEAEGDNTVWMAAWRQHGTATVDRAFADARRQNPKGFLIAGGAGCGGFFALIGAERHDVDAVLTLSGLSDEAQRARLTARRTPVLGIASKDDRDVPARVEAIVRAGGEGSVLKIYPGSAHGTAILTGGRAAPGDVRRWIEERTARARATPRLLVAPLAGLGRRDLSRHGLSEELPLLGRHVARARTSTPEGAAEVTGPAPAPEEDPGEPHEPDGLPERERGKAEDLRHQVIPELKDRLAEARDHDQEDDEDLENLREPVSVHGIHPFLYSA